MLKILLTIAIIVAIYLFFIKRPKVAKEHQEQTEKEKNNLKIDEDIMVKCEKCDTFVSSKEAIISYGKFYCCKDCAEIR